MCNELSQFFVEKYVHLKGFLDIEKCNQLTKNLVELVAKQKTNEDLNCPKSQAIYGDKEFEQLLVDMLPRIEKLTGKKLIPTYSYARLYKHGSKLDIHVDRESCEISATITLGFDSEPWPIYMGDENAKNASKIKMEVGDAVIYKGMEKHHWRKKLKNEWQAQVFLHYVDANGPYADWAWDKREKPKEKQDEMLHWAFTDVFTNQDCDLIVEAYANDYLKKESALIGSGAGKIDLSIRNVQRIVIPVYKDLGAQLVAAGLSANSQAWKFDITHSNQAEFLIYPTDGHYVSHVDTFMGFRDDCRKLTVLTFLNDDFKGGKFYFQIGHEKYYPPQNKGTVLVFPSFFLHGVEPVTEGTRYSAVCWMVGKFFK